MACQSTSVWGPPWLSPPPQPATLPALQIPLDQAANVTTLGKTLDGIRTAGDEKRDPALTAIMHRARADSARQTPIIC